MPHAPSPPLSAERINDAEGSTEEPPGQCTPRSPLSPTWGALRTAFTTSAVIKAPRGIEEKMQEANKVTAYERQLARARHKEAQLQSEVSALRGRVAELEKDQVVSVQAQMIQQKVQAVRADLASQDEALLRDDLFSRALTRKSTCTPECTDPVCAARRTKLEHRIQELEEALVAARLKAQDYKEQLAAAAPPKSTPPLRPHPAPRPGHAEQTVAIPKRCGTGTSAEASRDALPLTPECPKVADSRQSTDSAPAQPEPEETFEAAVPQLLQLDLAQAQIDSIRAQVEAHVMRRLFAAKGKKKGCDAAAQCDVQTDRQVSDVPTLKSPLSATEVNWCNARDVTLLSINTGTPCWSNGRPSACSGGTTPRKSAAPEDPAEQLQRLQRAERSERASVTADAAVEQTRIAQRLARWLCVDARASVGASRNAPLTAFDPPKSPRGRSTSGRSSFMDASMGPTRTEGTRDVASQTPQLFSIPRARKQGQPPTPRGPSSPTSPSTTAFEHDTPPDVSCGQMMAMHRKLVSPRNRQSSWRAPDSEAPPQGLPSSPPPELLLLPSSPAMQRQGSTRGDDSEATRSMRRKGRKDKSGDSVSPKAPRPPGQPTSGHHARWNLAQAAGISPGGSPSTEQGSLSTTCGATFSSLPPLPRSGTQPCTPPFLQQHSLVCEDDPWELPTPA
eukprot:TRINITY_DN60743_c0_g1_i1.p1 TRINITY_DN60743_c0_g1~~TRINITY_DN60743_c0_g1_i1.p1  ORF type:complete len:702 (+),score=145.58 TRINITY_DN60743_c0_g1_i1:83-2107(+)